MTSPSNATTPILAFDTSLGPCSVAIWRDGEIAAQHTITERNQQTSQLVPLIERLMRETSTTFSELGTIATTLGPGSFTGIRIGLATARGLALATGIPLTAISTLELFAWQAIHSDSTSAPERPIISAINAYRQQLYWQDFRYEASTLIPQSAPRIVMINDLRSQLPDPPTLITGNAHSLFADADTDMKRADIFAPSEILSAAILASSIANHSLPTSPRAQIKPLYLRAPDAKPQQPLLHGHNA